MTDDEKLMQQAFDALDNDSGSDDAWHQRIDALVALRARLVHTNDASEERVDKTGQNEHEPVAWTWEKESKRYFMTHDPSEVEAYHNLPASTPLYTAPPQREWQGLTDLEFSEIHIAWRETPDSLWDLYSAIEAKLKEKNNG